jgi:hypothetical protein
VTITTAFWVEWFCGRARNRTQLVTLTDDARNTFISPACLTWLLHRLADPVVGRGFAAKWGWEL